MITRWKRRLAGSWRESWRFARTTAAPLAWAAQIAWSVLGRRGQRIFRIVEGGRPRPAEGPQRVCLYSHFDRDGLLAPHVKYALARLAELGFRIHFVTTSRTLEQALIDDVAPYCERIIHKDNYGLDFGAWRLAWKLLRAQEVPDELLLMNDSVYGPVTDLGAVFARMAAADCDFWGITDSWDRRYHLQSYFLVLRRRALASPAFDRFWDGFWLINHKLYVVRTCEIGLSQRLLKAGLVPQALCPYVDVRDHVIGRLAAMSDEEREKRPDVPAEATLNPMHAFWKDLVAEFGCPFLKVELLARNPVAIADAYRWKQLVAETTTYDPALIERHLYRLVRKRAP